MYLNQIRVVSEKIWSEKNIQIKTMLLQLLESHIYSVDWLQKKEDINFSNNWTDFNKRIGL